MGYACSPLVITLGTGQEDQRVIDPEVPEGGPGRPAHPASVAEAEIVGLIDPLRRYALAHSPQPADAEDVVQEVLVRMLDVRDRLTPGTGLAYAIVTARNLIATRARSTAVFRRNRHRLIDLREPAEPEEVVIGASEREALRAALGELPPEQREALLAHVLEEEPVAALAVKDGTSPGSMAAQLARTRARLRVDYVVGVRSVRLPTARCRPVLLALSASDLRRQGALRAGAHLLTCKTCAELAPPLMERQRALVALLPWLGLGPALGFLRRVFRQPSVQVGAAGTAVVAAGVGAVLWASHPDPAPPPVRPPAPSVGLYRVPGGQSLLPVPADLASMSGSKVTGRSVPVASVPANEGFWVGDRARGRVWVRLNTSGRESKVTIKAGDVITFTGVLARNDADFARREGVSAAEGASLLKREGAHIVVGTSSLRIVRPAG
jgi:RNA polymerase sigma factor (sigma-70 family)